MKAYIVGGWCRDTFFGRQPKDKDFVVVGSTPEKMVAKGFLSVGKNFPVFLHPETQEEYALARKEICTGKKHTDFQFIFGPDITLDEDLSRRDFTINTLVLDPSTSSLVDSSYKALALEDIRNKVLRVVDPVHFIEDPLRVLRGCRFAADYGLTIHPDTLSLMSGMVSSGSLDNLPGERVRMEFEKAPTHNLSGFIQFLDSVGFIQRYIPSFFALKQTKEHPVYHPSGNSFSHTLLALERIQSQLKSLTYTSSPASAPSSFDKFLAILCHDFGKSLTGDGEGHFYDHHIEGVPLVETFLDYIKVSTMTRKFVVSFCRNHMQFHKVQSMRPGAIYDLLTDLGVLKQPSWLDAFLMAHDADYFSEAWSKSSPERQATYASNAQILRTSLDFLLNFSWDKSTSPNRKAKYIRLQGTSACGEYIRQTKVQELSNHLAQLGLGRYK